MNKVIVFKNDDGSCGIVNPAPDMFDVNSRTRKDLALAGIVFESDDDVLTYIVNKDVPADKPYRIVDKDNLPTNRLFRNAWTDDFATDTVDVDMDKARQIHMNDLRVIRDALLKKLDVAYQRADEQADAAQKAAVASQKQALRDMPQTFDLSVYETPDELHAAMPEILSNP